MANTPKADLGETRPNPVPTLNWLAIGTGFLSFGTVALILLGYGVSLAVESTFAIPHAAVFESTFELGDLASIAMVELIPAVTDAFTDGALLMHMYLSLAPVLGTAVGLLLLLGVIGWFCEPSKRLRERATPLVDAGPLHWGMTAKRYLLGNVLVGLSVLLSPLISLLGVFVIVLLVAVLALVPVTGMTAGKAYINKWVVGPERCRPSQTLEVLRHSTKLKVSSYETGPRYADCIALSKDAARIASGRVIFYTSKAVVLVDDTGRAKRVPTGDVVVEVIDSLPSDKVQ